MILVTNRDHHPAKLCLTWQFSNQRTVDSLENYKNIQWLYVGTGHLDICLENGQKKRYHAGDLVNIKEYSGKTIICEYPETGAFTFWVNGLDNRNRSCDILHSNDVYELDVHSKERWVAVISGHVDANKRHIPTRTLARIPPNTKVKFTGVTPKSLIANREEIESTEFTLAIFEDA